MTEQKEYAPEVVFGPIEEPVLTTDWRWQEVLALGPFEVMEELKELDTNLFVARSELREAVRELADLEDTLYRFKAEHLEKIAAGQNQDLKDRLFKGGTKDERAARQETHLSGMDSVQQWVAEIKVARERKDNAQVAFDSLLDRQTNLGKFAHMYSSTARLLASIRVPEPTVTEVGIPESILADAVVRVERMPDDQFEDLLAFIAELREERLFFVGEGKAPYSVVCKDDAEEVAQRAIAAKGDYFEVGEATYLAHRDAWISEEEVLAAMEAGGVELAVDASDDHDEGEYGKIEIPSSLAHELSEEEVDAVEAAVGRYEEEVPEEELPFQPDENLSL